MSLLLVPSFAAEGGGAVDRAPEAAQCAFANVKGFTLARQATDHIAIHLTPNGAFDSLNHQSAIIAQAGRGDLGGDPIHRSGRGDRIGACRSLCRG